MAITSEMILRRQINYLIIKETWCAYHGSKTQLMLYDKLKMSRQLYSRIMTGQCDTQLDKQAEYCSENTGIDIEIFRGKKVISIDGIKYEDWENFFGKTYYKKRSSDYKNFIKKLKDQIALANERIQKQGATMSGVDENLTLLIHYAYYGFRGQMADNYNKLNEVVRVLESFDITFLESVIEREQDNNTYLSVEKYMDTLKSQYELVHSVYIYNKKKANKGL